MSSLVRKPEDRPALRIKVGQFVQLAGALLALSALAVALFSSHAGATTVSNNTVTVKMASSGAVAVSPLSDGAVVDISVAANSELDRSSLAAAGYPSGAVPIKVLECEDSGGTSENLPTKATECEPETIDSTANGQANGSLFVKGFTVYALPDPSVLGASSGTVCDASHECVLGIFANQNDFSKPHIFSAPFEVTPGSPSANDPGGSSDQGTSVKSATDSSTVSSGASASSAASSATLANTGSPTIWPWLLVSGAALLIGGTGMRLTRRWG
jgi:hypothetical protein